MSSFDPWQTVAGWFWVAYLIGLGFAITLTLS
jgi:hypothetical protein